MSLGNVNRSESLSSQAADELATVASGKEGEPNGMSLVYSTLNVPLRDRVSYWVEVATRAFVVHEFTSLNGPSFFAGVNVGGIGDLGVSNFACDPCLVVRSARDVARDDSEDMLLCRQLVGKGYYEQDDRRCVIEAGDFVLIDARRPFSLMFTGPARTTSFRVPREGLKARLGETGGATARSISAKGAVGALVSGFLGMLPQRVGAIEPATGAQLSEHALNLIALAFSERAGREGIPQASQRTAALFRLKSVIETHLRNPLLKPATIAEEAGISVRYANDLLSQEGISVERYVLQRRLERCRSALEDPMQAHRKIGEIAYSWGFSDLSHFARRFRDAYAMSPSDCRKLALEGVGGIG